jgi:hypothetical protein
MVTLLQVFGTIVIILALAKAINYFLDKTDKTK